MFFFTNLVSAIQTSWTRCLIVTLIYAAAKLQEVHELSEKVRNSCVKIFWLLPPQHDKLT